MNPNRLIRNIEIARDTATQFSMLKEDVKDSPTHQRFNEAIDNIIEELDTVVMGKINKDVLIKSFFPWERR